jgi:hypothetical protein
LSGSNFSGYTGIAFECVYSLKGKALEPETVVAGLIGVGGWIIGLFSWRKAVEANSVAKEANRIAKEGNQIAVSANTISVEANEFAAKSLRVNEESLEHERIMVHRANQAVLVVKQIWVYSRDDSSVNVRVRIRNIGSAPARDVRLTILRNGLPTSVSNGNADLIDTVNPIELGFRATSKIYPRADESDSYVAHLDFSDGNGEHRLTKCFRFRHQNAPHWGVELLDCLADESV